MDTDDQMDIPTIRIKTVGDAHVVSFNIPTEAILEVAGVEVI